MHNVPECFREFYGLLKKSFNFEKLFYKMKQTNLRYTIGIVLIAISVLLSCSKQTITPINHINTAKSTCGEIEIGKVVCNTLFKQYGCFSSDRYTIHPEGNTIRGKILTNSDATIEIVCSAMSFLRFRYKCFAVELKGYDYYQINSSIIEKNMSADEVINILGKPDFNSTDSVNNSELLYDFGGLYNTIHIYFTKKAGIQYISGVHFG